MLDHQRIRDDPPGVAAALGTLGFSTDDSAGNFNIDLDVGATPAQVKVRFKELVKRHHPDVNGGDRSLEDRLREIIQAYNYLKSAKFC